MFVAERWGTENKKALPDKVGEGSIIWSCTHTSNQGRCATPALQRRTQHETLNNPALMPRVRIAD
jgi:hypothetical protein